MKSILTFSFVFLWLTTFCQTYIPFPTHQAQWNCRFSQFWYNSPNDNGTENDQLTYFTDGDTVINFMNYTKIAGTDLHNTYWIRPVTGVYQYSYFSGPGYIGCYRNDSINRRVLYLPYDSVNEKVLYDFSLNIGDTLHNWWTNKQGFNLNDFIIVSNIDSVQIDGIFRKRFMTTSSIGNTYPIIEGIGSEGGLLNPLSYDLLAFDGHLDCFKVNQKTIYPDSTVVCDNVNATEKIAKLESFIIFPNPSSGKIYLENLFNEFRIQIFDILGKEIFNSTIESKNFVIDLTGKENGIYFGRMISRFKEDRAFRIVLNSSN